MLRQVLFRPRPSGLVRSPLFRAIHVSARMRLESDIHQRVPNLENGTRQLGVGIIIEMKGLKDAMNKFENDVKEWKRMEREQSEREREILERNILWKIDNLRAELIHNQNSNLNKIDNLRTELISRQDISCHDPFPDFYFYTTCTILGVLMFQVGRSITQLWSELKRLDSEIEACYCQ